MPVSLAQMAARSATVTASTPVGDVTLTYAPHKFTTAALVQLDETQVARCAALADIIQSWDVYVDADMTQLVPIDAEHLQALSIDLTSAFVSAIFKDMRPN